mgnify:CR=1 FL=1
MLENPDRLPLVGRQAELSELLRQVESAGRGQGGLTLIYGEAGVGKSRLVSELVQRQREQVSMMLDEVDQWLTMEDPQAIIEQAKKLPMAELVAKVQHGRQGLDRAQGLEQGLCQVDLVQYPEGVGAE